MVTVCNKLHSGQPYNYLNSNRIDLRVYSSARILDFFSRSPSTSLTATIFKRKKVEKCKSARLRLYVYDFTARTVSRKSIRRTLIVRNFYVCVLFKTSSNFKDKFHDYRKAGLS